MRARIDISEIESETKIRAKYLRALENEEWNLLPGPTYVKTFLRTYAEALGLDAKLLVQEYKLRHERPSEHELRPISPPGIGRRRPNPPRVPRWLPVLVLVAGLLTALYFLGQNPPSDDADTVASPTATATTPEATATGTTSTPSRGTAPTTRPRSQPTTVSLRLIPTGTVYVCLVARGGRRLVDKDTLSAGDQTETFRSTRFLLSLGNGQMRLRVGSRTRTLASSSDPVGYQITRSGIRRLPESRRPTCGA